MKNKPIIICVLFLMLAVSALSLSACGESIEGTYYLYLDGNYVKTNFITLDNSTWTDDSGEQGTYEIKDGVIYIYSELFGEKELVSDGTIKDGVITVHMWGTDIYYCKEGSAPSAKNKDNNETTVKATVTYDANGGVFADSSATLSQSANIGGKLTAPESPTRKNYNFNGWAKNKNGSEMWNFATDNLEKNLTLYAVWQQQSAIILSVEGASIDDREIFMLVENNVETVSLSNKIICSTDSTWRLYYDKMGQTEIPTKIAATTSGELNSGENLFYIVVSSKDGTQVNVYTLNVYRSYAVPVVYYNGLTQLKIDYANTGKPFTADYTPTIKGYTFNGWQTESGTDFVSATVWQPLTLYAKKTINNYTVETTSNYSLAGTVNGAGSYTFESTVTLTATTNIGYTWIGWYNGNALLTNELTYSFQMPSYNINYTAKWAIDETYLTVFNWEKNDDTYIINGVKDKTVTNVIIPNYITTINYQAFKDCTSLKSINIPNSVTSIGDWAFANCSNLKSITIGNSVTSIGWYTFYKCSSLISITIPDSVISIGNYAFENCSSLTSINIPNSITSIGERAFYSCTKLQYHLYDNGYYLGNNFNQHLILIKAKNTSINSCIIHKETKFIDGYAFYNCSGLTSITIPDKTIVIGNYAFYKCSSLTSITIGNSVTSIGECAFNNCSNLISIIIPDSVTNIGKNAFEECSVLTSVTLGSSVKNIGQSAFRDCNNLTNINIPDSVISIGKYAFDGCSSLQYNLYNNVYYLGNNINQYIVLIKAKYLSGTSCIIHNDTKFICENAFVGCRNLTNINIPDSVISIGRYAFLDCRNLTNINIPDSVTRIEEYAFQDCSSLTSINYNGTSAQWNSITKETDWKKNVPTSCKVYCTDGPISI